MLCPILCTVSKSAALRSLATYRCLRSDFAVRISRQAWDGFTD